uniref:Ig-like domain-containing protein n=1 Tax=Xenopus tropicalis TaxID=8364 RepID=A0A1B8Y401_XENTR
MSHSGLEEFTMGAIQGPPVWLDGEKLTLYCTASSCPQDVKVSWILKAQDGTMSEFSEAGTGEAEEEQPLISREYIVSKEKTTRPQKNGLCDYSSTFCFIPSASRHLGSSVSCKFVCGGKTQEKAFQFKAIQGKKEVLIMPSAKPRFIEPISISLCDSGNVQLLATLERFYPKEGIKVTWRCNKEKPPETNAPMDELITHPDNTFTVRSKYEIPGDQFKDPDFKVCVSWNHDSMEKAESREVSVKDFPWRPTMDDIPLQSERENNKLRLSCNISNYFPDALTVSWFGKKKGSQELFPVTGNDIYVIQKPQSERGTNYTYKCKACLVLPVPESTEQEMEYICRVGHPSLKEPIQGGTGPVQKYDLGEKRSFIVHHIQGPQRWQEGEKVTLYGTALYCKRDVQVTWIVTERDGTIREIPDVTKDTEEKLGANDYVACRERTEQSDHKGLIDITTSLSFTASVSRHKSMSLKCKFVCDGKSSEKLFQYKDLYVKPKRLKPIELSLLENGEVLCSLSLQQFYPKTMQISWGAGVPPSYDKMESAEEVTDSGLTYDLLSKCRIPGRLLRDPDFTVRASWKHEFMSDWESTQLSLRDPGFPWKPVVQNIPLPNLFAYNPVTLMCQVSNIFPESVTVKWFRREKDGEDLFPVSHSEKYKIPEVTLEKQEDETFQCRARLTFTPTVSSEHGAEFICRVEHPSLEKPEERRAGPLHIEEEKKFISVEEQKFIVKDIQGPDKWTLGKEVTLYAMASYCPKDIGVIWIIRERDGKVWEICDTPTERGKKPTAPGPRRYAVTRESTDPSDKEGLIHVTSSMRFTPSVSAHSGVSLMCRFVCDGKTEEREFKPRALYAKPKLLEPIKPEWCNNEKVKFSLNLGKFYPKDVEISWTSGVGASQKKKKPTDQLQENPNRTFNIQSTCTISQRSFRDPTVKVCVSWKHESMGNPESREFSLQDLGDIWRPIVEAIPLHQIVVGRQVALQYRISGYFPDALTVSWYKKEKGREEPVPITGEGKYGIPDSVTKEMGDGTLTRTESLAFSPSLSEEHGAEFICRVAHPILQEPIEKSSGPLFVWAKPKPLGDIKPTLCGAGEVLLSFSLGSFYPKDLTISWACGVGDSQQLQESTDQLQENPDLTFSIHSGCRIPGNLFHNPTFRVCVRWNHGSMGNPESKEFTLKDLGPEAHPIVLPQPETDGKPQPVLIPQPETDGKPQPVLTSQPETDGKPRPVLIPQPETDGKPRPVVIPQPETDGKPRPVLIPQPETDGKPRPVLIPQPETDGKPQPVLIPQPETDGSPGLWLYPNQRLMGSPKTDGKPQPVLIPQPETDVKHRPVLTPQPETDGEPQPVLIPQPETDGKPQPVLIPQPETDGKHRPVLTPQPETDGKPQPVLIPQPETDGEPQPVVIPHIQETDGKPWPEVIPQPETDGEPQPVVIPHIQETDGKPWPEVIPQPETDGKPQSVLIPQPETDGKPQSVLIPQPETDGKPQSVLIPQPETDGEPQPVLIPHIQATDGKPWPEVIPQPETDGESRPEEEREKGKTWEVLHGVPGGNIASQSNCSVSSC